MGVGTVELIMDPLKITGCGERELLWFVVPDDNRGGTVSKTQRGTAHMQAEPHPLTRTLKGYVLRLRSFVMVTVLMSLWDVHSVSERLLIAPLGRQ